MFNPVTTRLATLSSKYPSQIEELKIIFEKSTNVYIDYANVIHWHKLLGWHISLRRLQQLLRSFTTINSVKFYAGFFPDEEARMIENRNNKFKKHESLLDNDYTIIQLAELLKFEVRKKPVKIMHLSIDTSSIPENVPTILQNFIDNQLLEKMSLETITMINRHLKELNNRGVKYIEKRKCNFDVELGTDMRLDCERNNNKIETFVLWSGDSDFAEPIEKIIDKEKKVVLFATARRIRITTELEQLKTKGLYIFDIKKLKEFICFPREMQKGSQ